MPRTMVKSCRLDCQGRGGRVSRTGVLSCFRRVKCLYVVLQAGFLLLTCRLKGSPPATKPLEVKDGTAEDWEGRNKIMAKLAEERDRQIKVAADSLSAARLYSPLV